MQKLQRNLESASRLAAGGTHACLRAQRHRDSNVEHGAWLDNVGRFAPPVDAYAAVQRSVKPDQIITDVGFNGARGLAVAPDGSIYVADTGNSRMVRLDANGSILTTWGSRAPDG